MLKQMLLLFQRDSQEKVYDFRDIYIHMQLLHLTYVSNIERSINE